MTNRDRLLATIRAVPGLTDAEPRARTGVEPHQQVNQICRRLEHEGLVTRTLGPAGHIVNRPVAAGEVLVSPPASPAAHQDESAADDVVPTVRRRTWWRRRAPGMDTTAAHAVATLDLPPVASSLVLLPCSGRKAQGGRPVSGPSVLDILPARLAQQLSVAREQLAAAAGRDESTRLPARERYSGALYRMVGGTTIGAAAVRGQAMVILSGGYGLVLPDEPIGWYDRAFSLGDWPRGLLQECLVALVDELHCSDVVAFCARTTGYAELVRSTRWTRGQLRARLVSPILTSRGGAQVRVPQALGTALNTYLTGGTITARSDTSSFQVEVMS